MTTRFNFLKTAVQKVLLNKLIYFFEPLKNVCMTRWFCFYALQVCIYTKKKSQMMNVLLVLTFWKWPLFCGGRSFVFYSSGGQLALAGTPNQGSGVRTSLWNSPQRWWFCVHHDATGPLRGTWTWILVRSELVLGGIHAHGPLDDPTASWCAQNHHWCWLF